MQSHSPFSPGAQAGLIRFLRTKGLRIGIIRSVHWGLRMAILKFRTGGIREGQTPENPPKCVLIPISSTSTNKSYLMDLNANRANIELKNAISEDKPN